LFIIETSKIIFLSLLSCGQSLVTLEVLKVLAHFDEDINTFQRTFLCAFRYTLKSVVEYNLNTVKVHFVYALVHKNEMTWGKKEKKEYLLEEGIM
jgi:hypothetical protein